MLGLNAHGLVVVPQEMDSAAPRLLQSPCRVILMPVSIGSPSHPPSPPGSTMWRADEPFHKKPAR